MLTRQMSPPSESDGHEMNIKQEEDDRHLSGRAPALTPPTSEGTIKDIADDSGSDLSELEPDQDSDTETQLDTKTEMSSSSKPEKVSPKIEPSIKTEMEENIKSTPLKDQGVGIEAMEEDSKSHRDEQTDDEIRPDHYYEGGKVPVFKPTMAQFASFKDFISKVDRYGMKSGIIKVIPPKEWRDALPALDEHVKTIRVKNPITQEFHGTHGTYTQANIEKQRSYNLPQWKALCEESNHQPPARRGQRRRNQDRSAKLSTQVKTTSVPENLLESPKITRGRGAGKNSNAKAALPSNQLATSIECKKSKTSTKSSASKASPAASNKPKKSVGGSAKSATSKRGAEAAVDGKQRQSVGSRRLHNKRDQVDVVDEEAFHNFDYRSHTDEDWSSERLHELETAYWRSLNFNNPMYGADMPGSLFDDRTTEWNVAKLENLLDVLGQKVPGVNTAYLYLGMWKASFAWHLEDVDLYSINYIHFGAPKQWYSISQEDARKFESAMKSIWPTDAKSCDQFLRHKTYLISPQLLQSQFGIKVNRLVHHEGEFVITYPYGYHSGYNLGYNCAESVNFATESWLDYGKVARKCNCEADSVWIDAREIERKLRGEPSPEYYEETDDGLDDDDETSLRGHLPTPPASVKGKGKSSAKPKKGIEKKNAEKVKKLKLRIRLPSRHEPCALCPNDNKYEELIATDDGRRAHRRCGLYTPETFVSEEADGSAMVRNISMIDKARFDLKCNFCRSKKGGVFQCCQKKCTRAYHATCAMAAGVQIDIGPTAVWGDDGTEYVDTGYDFRCRMHRSKRSKNADSHNLETNELIMKKASKLVIGDCVQAQYLNGNPFAGHVVEIWKDEQSVVLETLPRKEIVEVEWKWLLFFDPVNSQLPMPSEKAIPLPMDLLRSSQTNAEHPATKIDAPIPGDVFCDNLVLGQQLKWGDFSTCRSAVNKFQVQVDLHAPNQLWHFLGERSSDFKPLYTHDPAIRQPSAICANQLNQNLRSIDPVNKIGRPRLSMPSTQSSSSATIGKPGTGQARAGRSVSTSSTNPRPVGSSSEGKFVAYSAPSVPRQAVPRPYKGKYAVTDTHMWQDPRRVQKQVVPSFSTTTNPYPVVPAGSPRAISALYPSSRSTYISKPDSVQSMRLPAFQSTGSKAAAPIANMMGPSMASCSGQTAPPPSQSSTSSSQAWQTNASTDTHLFFRGLKGISHLPVSARFVYLHNAEKCRPRVYESPYDLGGGFTDAYKPAGQPVSTSQSTLPPTCLVSNHNSHPNVQGHPYRPPVKTSRQTLSTSASTPSMSYVYGGLRRDPGSSAQSSKRSHDDRHQSPRLASYHTSFSTSQSPYHPSYNTPSMSYQTSDRLKPYSTHKTALSHAHPSLTKTPSSPVSIPPLSAMNARPDISLPSNTSDTLSMPRSNMPGSSPGVPSLPQGRSPSTMTPAQRAWYARETHRSPTLTSTTAGTPLQNEYRNGPDISAALTMASMPDAKQARVV